MIRGLPQPLKIHHSGRIDGVSPASTALIAVVSLVWLAYAVWVWSPPTILSGVAAAVATIWCAVLVWRLSAHRRLMFQVAAIALAVSAAVAGGAALFGLGSGGLAVVLTAATVFYGVPRLIAGMTSVSLAGVSPAYLALNVADAVVFGVIGVWVSAPGYVGYAVIQIATSLPVLLRWVLRPAVRN